MRRLGVTASAGVFYAHRIVGEHGKSLAVFAAVGIIHRRDAEIAEKALLWNFRTPEDGNEK
jgi:hypothetical protein